MSTLTLRSEGEAPLERIQAASRKASRKSRKIPGSVFISLSLIVFFALLVIVGPFIAPNATMHDLATGTTTAGTPGHIFGTDTVGRDVLALAIAGARSSLLGPLIIAVGSMFIGVVLGTFAAYSGGWRDNLISRICEILLSLPVTLLAIVVAGVIGAGYWITVGLLVVLFAPSDVRNIRAATLHELPRPYIESTFMLGLSTPRILFGHILPNLYPIVRANLLTNIAFALVSMSGLSYLGFGVQADAADWGRQLSDGRDLLYVNPAAVIVPGILIILAATAINIAGDWWAERQGGTREQSK